MSIKLKGETKSYDNLLYFTLLYMFIQSYSHKEQREIVGVEVGCMNNCRGL